MVKRLFKYLITLIVCVMLLLVITNPSPKKLNEFIGNNDGVIRRKENWIFFSKYEYSFISQVYPNKYRDLETIIYLGIFSNFYKLRNEKRIILPQKKGAEKNDWIIK